MWRRSSLTSGLHILSYPADRWYLGRACIYPMCGILILPTAYNRSKNKGVCHMSQETLLALIIISPFLIALIALPFLDTISVPKSLLRWMQQRRIRKGSAGDLNTFPGPASTGEATTVASQNSVSDTLATLPVQATTTVLSVGAALTRAANHCS